MDAGSEAVDLMVREGLQITEASIKLLAAGSKNLAAFLPGKVAVLNSGFSFPGSIQEVIKFCE